MFRIFKKFVYRKLDAFDILFRQGEYGYHMFICINGELQVSRTKNFEERNREKEGGANSVTIIEEEKMPVEEIRRLFLQSLVTAFRLKGGNNKIDWDTQIIVKYLNGGDTFGELALTVASGRTATVMALKPSHLIQLDRETFCSIMDQEVEENKHHSFIIQKNLPFLQVNHMTELVVRMEKLEVSYGQVLQDFDEPASNLFLVKKGILKIEMKTSYFKKEVQKRNELEWEKLVGEENVRVNCLRKCLKLHKASDSEKTPICLIMKGKRVTDE